MVIGQGRYLEVTPIQLINAYAAIANGGTLYTPKILLKRKTPNGTIVHTKRTIIGKPTLSSQTRKTIIESLHMVCNNKIGTAYRAQFNPQWGVAGKTGTAEIANAESNSWFVGFAPYNDPELVVLVMREHAGHGSEIATPIAKKIFKYYFEEMRQNNS